MQADTDAGFHDVMFREVQTLYSTENNIGCHGINCAYCCVKKIKPTNLIYRCSST